MNTKEAVKDIINFLFYTSYPKVLCIGISKNNKYLKGCILDVLSISKWKDEFIVAPSIIKQKDNSYNWFCKFIDLSLTGNKNRNLERIIGFTAQNILIVLNNIPKELDYITPVIDMYMSNNNKTKLIEI